ncbi:MAG: response regulator transcription factor [Gemmatimonadetes bacterium]|nr:response regulator transcription factor [Gemmatimonadota bacterium]
MSEIEKKTVVVVDDEESVRRSLTALLQSVGMDVCAFGGPEEVLKADLERPGCVVLDIRMPGMSGLEVFDRLRERFPRVPILFITGHGEVSLAVRAMKAGAMDFLEKPFSHQELVDRVQEALELEDRRERDEAGRRSIESRLSTLTGRERNVLELIIAGMSSKMIAAELGISIKTVEAHRTSTMQKMQAKNAADLVRLAVSAGMAGE